ncbi:3695_t:CDS:2 [Ambispora gerdemannii]|uniref:3695_t:CDS:1 n=1 Tax=Ambispora gerdemannii TaxID=144530 RepID=A0A9N8V2E0_9GLOM|nr:3695_t:CDS:2 [Ambispora gerdemannii]
MEVPTWTPLPKFGYGFAIYPYAPGAPQLNASDDPAKATNNDGASDTASINSADLTSPAITYQVQLEVGDEVYVFEEQGAWYRGYVVSQLRQTEEPQVYVGIFPINHVYIKEYLENVELGVHKFKEEEVVDPSFSPSPERKKIRPPPPLPSLTCGDDTISGKTEPLIDEIASTVREWSSLLPQYLEQRRYSMFNTVKEQINNLLQGRRQLLAQTLSHDELSKLRKELINRLVSGNLIQELDIIVRNPEKGFLADETNISAIQLYQLQAQLAVMNVDKSLCSDPLASVTTGTPQTNFNSWSNSHHSDSSTSGSSGNIHAAKFYHVFLDLKAWVASISTIGEYTELYFSLYTKTDARFITEEYFIILNHNGVPKDQAKIGKMRTLFTDLSPHDIQDDIFLVCRIVRAGSMKLVDKDKDAQKENGAMSGLFSKSSRDSEFIDQSTISIQSIGKSTSQVFRRPFGCAVLDISHLLQGKEKESLSEHVMPIFVSTQESTFATLHEDIIHNRTKEFEKSSRAEMVSVSIRPFHGETATVIKENPALLQGIPITSRLGFADVVFPGDSRNEIYLKLWSGDFSQGRSTTAKNIQVTAEVRLNTGEILEHAISQGSGEPQVTQFESLVFYHSNNPMWGELIKLKIPVDLFEQVHVFFTFRHRSTKDKKEDKMFAFAYMPLFPENRAFISDGKHSLILYKHDRQLTNPSVYMNSPWSNAATIQSEPTSPTSLGHTHHHNNSSTSLVSTGSSHHHKLMVSKDIAIVRTFLCSTKYTQNEVLLKLLNWEKQLKSDENEMMSVLKKFTFVGEVEIVKFLQDIFDALFGILVSSQNQQSEFDDLVFNALVIILAIVSDRRFMNFRPVLDVYIEKHYSCAAASSHLIRSMNRLVSDPGNVDTAKNLRSAVKVWQYLFKFIIRSRELQRTKETNIGVKGNYVEEQFKKDLWALFKSIDRLMSLTTPPSIIGTQTLALQHFASIFTDLGKCFSSDDLVQIAIKFTESVRLPKGKLLAYKLLVILQFCRGPLFENAESRATLLRRIVEWVKDHMGKWEKTGNDQESAERTQWQDGLKLCVTIIGVTLESLQNSIGNASDEGAKEMEIENVCVILPLLMKLCESYRELQYTAQRIPRGRTVSNGTALQSAMSMYSGIPPTPTTGNSLRFSKDFSLSFNLTPLTPTLTSGLGEISAVILQIFFLTSQQQMKEHLLSQYFREGADSMAEYLILLFKVAQSILINDAFPESWLNMNIMTHKVLLKLLEPVSSLLEKNYIPNRANADAFNERLWREYFSCLLTLLSSKHLVIENFTPQKRRAVWRLAGDIRGRGAQLLSKLWKAIGRERGKTGKIGGYQAHYVSALLGPILELCLSHHDELRTSAIGVLFSMILTQYSLDENFKKMESDIIDNLDRLFMSEKKGDEISRAYFIAHLKRLFENKKTIDKRLRVTVTDFLDSLGQFLELLLGVRELPEGEEYQDDRIMCTLKLMKFIKSIERDEIYVKYVHQLVYMQANSNNFVEAGLTLKLHADLFKWDPNSELEAIPELDLPKQSPFARKERLYIQILDYFVKGRAWECGIELCKELVRHLEFTTYDYQRLSDILKQQAVLFENIIKKERYFSEYFRVGFYGRGFPASLQNRQFIYRGYEWEKIGAFCERMQNKHPQAQLLKFNTPPPDDILYDDGQFLQVTAVTPEPDRDNPVFKGDISSSVRGYYEHNAVNTFSFSRPVNKNPDGVKSNNEFLDLWTEKTILVSEETFPTVLRRSEVVNVELIEVSPIENALAAMKAKNRELLALEAKYGAHLKTINLSTPTSTKINTNPLSMSLNGAVDAPVNGGVPMYKKAFFDTDFLTANPDKELLVQKLKGAIDEQVEIIDRCLELHDRLVAFDMRPLHDTLIKFFNKNFADEISRLSERKKAAAAAEPPAKILSSQLSSSPTEANSPITISSSFRKPSLYAMAPFSGESTSPVSPTASSSASIISRVAAAKLQTARPSIITQGLNNYGSNNSSSNNDAINSSNSIVSSNGSHVTIISSNNSGNSSSFSNHKNNDRIFHGSPSNSSSDVGSHIEVPSSPNGDTITEIPMISHQRKGSILKERKGSMVFGERRMTIKKWSLNRSRSTTR